MARNAVFPLPLAEYSAAISGPITDMQFTFSEREGARLKVCGEDDLCILKNKNPEKVDYWARPEREIVEDEADPALRHDG